MLLYQPHEDAGLTVRSGADDPDRAGRPASRELYLAIASLTGHAAMESALGPAEVERLLERMRRRVREEAPEGAVWRVGSGRVEFTFEAEGEAQAMRRLEELHRILSSGRRGRTGDHQMRLGATAAPPILSKHRAVQQAEAALRAAESDGRPFAIFSREIQAQTASRLSLVEDLRVALEERHLTVAYQPKLNLRTGEMDAVEALVRWRHPERGEVSPDLFIPLAEETGDVDGVTRCVLEQVIADARALSAQGHRLAVNVNLSASLLVAEDFCDHALSMLKTSPLPIGLEITETGLISDAARALRSLERFAAAGVHLAIDDYGAGLSSLSYLQLLPVAELKLDKQFIIGLTKSQRGPLIVRSTIDLAHALGMEITAEGVDDPATLALLRVMRCDYAQGYLVSRPVDVERLGLFLREGRPPAASTARHVLGPLRRPRRPPAA